MSEKELVDAYMQMLADTLKTLKEYVWEYYLWQHRN